MNKFILRSFDTLDLLGVWLGLLSLRVLLGWDYFESGLEKFRGTNWFADIQERFPFPFNVVPPEISWQMATWFELLGGVALVIGLATRFFTVSLLVLTVVAIAAVHWPDNWSSLAELMQGYVFTDKGQGNFKLPVLFMGMLLPLLLLGPGKLSLDAWIRTALRRRCAGQASQHAAGEPMTCPKTP
jgi:putative oxidoreductase